MEGQRPDPDRLLTRLKRDEHKSGRAKLKVFFGFAPGVGKTYAMLEAARRLPADGVDVVVGYVETHGRAETRALLDGLSVLPRRTVVYRGAQLEDFDLNAALARHPAVLLVDELPHTNAPEGRHTKRWQDVFDLLEAGIDVHTTLNVQHIESLNDVVARITGVTVRETVPDAVLERADEIELVDISLEELLARLDDGKVYVPEQAKRAAASFFSYGNLLALRELALRRTAERIEAEVRTYRETHELTHSWAARERLLVAVGPSPGSAKLVRAAKRMATRLEAPWAAVYVERPASKPMPATDRERLEAQLRLAESLGGGIVRLTGTRVSETLLDYARRHDVSRMILGKPTHPRWRDLYGGSLLDEVVRGSGEIDVLVISGDEGSAPPRSSAPRQGTPWGGIIFGAVLVAIATAIGWWAKDVFDSADVVMLYLLAIVVTATRFTRRASFATAAISVIAYDFFFIVPTLDFAVADTKHWLTFVMLFAVGATISTLTQRVRRHAVEARAREERTASLYALARALGAASNIDDVARVLAQQVSTIFHCPTAVLYPDGEGLRDAANARELTLGPPELAVARWTLDHGRPAGRGTETLPGARIVCIPLMATGTTGALALEPRAQLSTDQRHFLEVMARQAAIAVERDRLADEARGAAVKARTEELRSALLSTVSHDLRTPLAIITGSATTLRDSGDAISHADRNALVDAVCDEASRMERLVGNLLDMTRLEAGIDVKRDWVPLDDLIGAATSQLEAQLANRRVEVRIAGDVPMVAVDVVLFPQVFVNLLENATKYTPADTPFRITATYAHKTVTVEFADRGPGFAGQDPSKLFEKFVRGAQQDRTGVGLGLAIVRGIVTAHGGEVSAGNRAEGGAVVRFTIPIIGEPPTVTLDEHVA